MRLFRKFELPHLKPNNGFSYLNIQQNSVITLKASGMSSRNYNTLVSSDWLAANLDTVIPLDCSWHMPGTNRNPHKEYLNTRIRGARFFGIDEIKDRNSNLPHMLPSPEDFAKAVGNLGISETDHIIAYDSIGVFSAPRAYWTFKVFGHEKVSVLDGGLPRWLAEKREIENGPVTIMPKNYPIPLLNYALVRNYEDMIENIKRGPTTESHYEQVIDARPESRFYGTDKEPRPGLPSGHMPYSISIPFDAVIDSSTKTLRNEESLRELFESKNVKLSQPIVLSCGSGITASILYFSLERIGAQKIAVYDGSWTEYAEKAGSPIIGKN
ncbi:hypothetical protein G9A89_006112 [Geosiphon pyriformis]|nr:hypothetical protein G9A89_006112 [Geosiphon pyriformis]